MGTEEKIDALRQAEAAVREKERYRALTDSVPGMIWTAAPDGSNNYANQRWYDYTGLTPEQSLGYGWTLAVHPDDLPGSLNLWRRHLESGEPGEAELRLRRWDGTYRWFLLRTVPRRDEQNRILEWFGTTTDIDDRKRAAEALRESEERFRCIVETSAEGIWVIDAESRTTYANRRMAEMLGSTVQEMLGCFPNDFLFAEDLEEARTLFRLKRQGDDRPFDFRLRRKDGSAIWCSIANRPLSADRGQFLGVLGMFSDISDRKRLEQSLKEADRLKDEFIASLAHELRNLLAPVRSAANVLNAKGSSDATLELARGLIQRQVEQMARLVADLLDVSRITHNRLELRRERTELAAVVQSAIEISRPLIDASRHELTVALPSTPIYLDADPSRLAQALANLLNNAAKFTEKPGRIWLTGEQQASQVVLTIKDTGIGISAEKLQSIFEMFTQAESSLGQSQGGLGIGLTLVRRLVEMHGGRIEARSGGPGEGSEFIVHLPLVSVSAEQIAPP